jgi:hypothetical protein
VGQDFQNVKTRLVEKLNKELKVAQQSLSKSRVLKPDHTELTRHQLGAVKRFERVVAQLEAKIRQYE